jgi:molecular chaperone IbpA
MTISNIHSLFPASFVGFDRLFDEIDKFSTPQTYPPHNLIKVADDKWAIELAVAGFAENEITVEAKEDYVTIVGKKEGDDTREYAHKGISARKFERKFKLADHVEVKGAAMQNGILAIGLERIVPEELKPREIKIQTGSPELLLES